MSIKRDTIISAVEARLSGITPANGYHVSLTGKIGTWQPVPRDSWGVVLVPASERIDSQRFPNKWDRKLSLAIVVVVDGSASAATVSQVIEDIYKAIGTDITWSGNVINTEPIGFEMEVDQNEKRITGATITVEITYRTDAWAES